MPHDPTGLSAFTSWLAELLAAPATRAQILPADLTRLDAALALARGFVGTSASQKAADRKHAELEASLARPARRAPPFPSPPLPPPVHARSARAQALLGSIVPPSHPLFGDFFPERAICLEYERAKAEARAAQKRDAALAEPERDPSAHFATYEASQSAKYGVEWQCDADADECTLCAATFSLLRRRHHCRTCGRIVCGACSKQRCLTGAAAKPKRSCDACVAARQEPEAEPEAEQPEQAAERGPE